MITLLNLACFLFLGYWAARALRSLSRGYTDCMLFVLPIHFVFCGVPPLLDATVGRPAYHNLPGVSEAASDPYVNVIYCLYVSLCAVIWWGTGPRRAGGMAARRGEFLPLGRRPLAMLVGLCLAPLVLAHISPSPSMYLDYPAQARLIYEPWAERERQFNVVLTKVVILSLIAAAVLVRRSRRPGLTLLLIAPVVVADIWLHGKRNAAAVAMALLIYAFWDRGTLAGRRLVAVAVVALAGFFAFSHYYQTRLRYSEVTASKRSSDDWMQEFRIDYGRDDVIKVALHHEVHSELRPILESRGESLAALATVWVPRSLWPDKPASYARRLTVAAMHGPPPGDGALTTGVLDEAVANFGWAGLLIGPLVIVAVCRVGDASRDDRVHLLSILVTVFLQTIHITPWLPIALLWAALAVRERLRRREVLLAVPAGRRFA